MTETDFPIHRLCSVNNEGNQIFLAVTGPCIKSISWPDGKVLSKWPRDDNGESDEEEDEQEPPGKRQKLNDSGRTSLRRQESEASEASIEIVAEGQKRQKGERRRPKIPDLTLPNVSHLITTSDGKHAVAITAEDKTVRVLSVSKKGGMRQLSARSMPKKCCAITLTTDEKTILTADKFGDVYALPLHPSLDYKPKATRSGKTYEPSATELTVHTKGNLDALKQQQKQKQKPPKKEGPTFEHKLLLGHVSLLTDLVVAQGDVDGISRSFILTADRDEHIRVSRGIPQTHVIHSFCLGHTEFVSKLCILPWEKRALIAGNGEPSLRVYDWQSGRHLTRYNLLEELRQDIEPVISPMRSIEKLAVSGIWAVQWSAGNIMLVTLEALPFIFTFSIADPEIVHWQSLKFDGNVLDIVKCPGQDTLAVAIDTVHERGSFKDYRTSSDHDTRPIQFVDITDSGMITNVGSSLIHTYQLVPSRTMQGWTVGLSPYVASSASAGQTDGDAKTKNYEKIYSPIGEFVYGLENLRKRRGKGVEDEDDEDGQGDEGQPDSVPEVPA